MLMMYEDFFFFFLFSTAAMDTPTGSACHFRTDGGTQRHVMESIFIVPVYHSQSKCLRKRPDSVTFSGSYCITGKYVSRAPCCLIIAITMSFAHEDQPLGGDFARLAHH